MLERDKARNYFVEKGLYYTDIQTIDIRLLSNMLESELLDYIKNNSVAKQMDMQVASIVCVNLKVVQKK